MIKLQKLDYVKTKGLNADDRRMVADAFIQAGAEKGSLYPYDDCSGQVMGWDNDGTTFGFFDPDRCEGIPREITIGQIREIMETEPPEPKDIVNHPPHYNSGPVECIDGIVSALGRDGAIAYCRGNAIKYLWRCDHKGAKQQDLEKARWYISKAIELEAAE